ncbi:protein Lst7p [[Candida] jaroonii]|uniref:Protein Lst7p n=1 Tax=[Candida] jaroonii TaxID=467808 RepID=A0ACA9YDW4_9ASCO|nr:protein Lst7p [[Candida] jaroonii]
MANFTVCLGHFCEVHGPCSIISTQISKTKNILKTKASNLQTCQSCQLSLPNDVNNIVTKSKNEFFISSQYPSNQDLYRSLTKLIMKILSVETSDISKPLFLGDNANGFTLTRIFKIKDLNARGGERKYCLMIVSDEEHKIMKNWRVSSNYLNEIIDFLQSKVNKNDNSSKGNNNDNYLRRSLVKPKSLIELCGDKQIFIKLHLSAIELIKDIK